MKNYLKYIYGAAAVLSITATGCKKDFFNRPPESGVTVGNYYQTAEQVRNSTNGLYGSPWFGWNNKAGWSITELAGGNGRTYSSDVIAFMNLNVSNTNPLILAAWDSPFTVIAQANGILNNLPTSVPASVPTAVVNNALGEARLMRATAYFYLVRTFGNVPLIENPLDYVNNSQAVPSNPVSDVYKFIVRDLQFAEANCSAGVTATGHGSSGSASALLAKVYLYMQDYANARKQAEKVINSGEFSLLPNINDLFKTANNNNKESILAMQWIHNGGYDYGNSIQASWAFSSAITQTGDGYGVLGPSFDLQNAFKEEGGDSTRRHATYMVGGSYYSEINQAGGGYKFPFNGSGAGTHAAPKKYVVGSPADNGGKSAAQATALNTYIMRYADVLLIEAEAILGQQAGVNAGQGIPFTASTSDATALKYFNMVRKRVNVPEVTSFTYRDLLRERRLEFALEQDYWFDLGRIDGYNVTKHPRAIAIINNQERGDSSGGSEPYYQDYEIYSKKVTATDANFVFPIPVRETTANPALLQPPVPYVFK
ncbi:RagB/SusD family nutrient uptake outer membrane protein [Mucilaginibacter sp. Bleaf8]|uniref:RagB/SusD family nutrient uptake outer membrane protein n=1 Tax=Mucilaginibacter sp. Bleaf8 TaxID=2834430 RepID=UPI001BD07CB2|nr:RagB/SusD family nutrient uptake outer membrane protein [Mucilaginibacter sp. Bleaf8]MBS7566663.1 RagB/SusD family nutrient uptake outer membrane protein [Mucilaginibacter sp. Bleaf8]